MIQAILILLFAVTAQDEPEAPQADLQCHTGPAIIQVGGHDWNMYACNDGETVVLAAGPPNPAAFFYFIIQRRGEGIRLYGEGNGDRAATEPSYNELKELTAAQLAEYYQLAVDAHRE